MSLSPILSVLLLNVLATGRKPLGVILSYFARRNTQDPAFGKEGKNADRMAFSTRFPVSAREVGIHNWVSVSVSAS